MLTLNLITGTLSHGDDSARFSGYETAILHLLLQHRNRPVSRSDIMRHLYGMTEQPNIKVLDVFICYIRKGILGMPLVIRTIRGYGYKLETEIDVNVT